MAAGHFHIIHLFSCAILLMTDQGQDTGLSRLISTFTTERTGLFMENPQRIGRQVLHKKKRLGSMECYVGLLPIKTPQFLPSSLVAGHYHKTSLQWDKIGQNVKLYGSKSSSSYQLKDVHCWTQASPKRRHNYQNNKS